MDTEEETGVISVGYKEQDDFSALRTYLSAMLKIKFQKGYEYCSKPTLNIISFVGRPSATASPDIAGEEGDAYNLLLNPTTTSHQGCAIHIPVFNRQKREGQVYLCFSDTKGFITIHDCPANRRNIPVLREILDLYRSTDAEYGLRIPLEEKRVKTETILDEPWRKGVPYEWSKKEVLEIMGKILTKHEVLSKLLTNEERQRGLTVFLVGPPGHGKSSTINGLISAIENERAEEAVVRTQSDHSTLEFRRFRPRLPVISNNDICLADDLGEVLFNISFADFVGMDSHADESYITSMKAALFGMLRQGHKAEFPDEGAEAVLKERASKSYVEESTVESCCVIWVVDVRCQTENFNYMNAIVKEATRYGIPQFLALTKCDNIDENVAKNPRNMYFSRIIEEAATATAAIVGVPMYRTFPIKNFITELEVEPNQSLQYLYMLQYILADVVTKLRQLFKSDPERREAIRQSDDEKRW